MGLVLRSNAQTILNGVTLVVLQFSSPPPISALQIMHFQVTMVVGAILLDRISISQCLCSSRSPSTALALSPFPSAGEFPIICWYRHLFIYLLRLAVKVTRRR